jgi:hypothetical protein
MGYPKDCIFVFDPALVTFCDDYAKRLATTKDDPWLAGHFSDNELPLYTKALDNFLKLSPDDAGRQAVDQWLKERHAKHPGEPGLTDEMRQDFLGFANTTGAGWVVKTQADRGRFYQNFTLGLIESGGCVGWHWFKYRDNDPTSKTADPSNLDSNKGIVNLRLEPYAPRLQAMAELNRQVYSLAAYFDGRKQ